MSDKPQQSQLLLSPQYLNFPTEEAKSINLLPLIFEFYKRRWTMLIIVVCCLMVAMGITYFRAPQYNVSTFLVPPKPYQIQRLYLNTDSNMSAKDLFTLFTRKLSQPGVVVSYLQESGLIDKELKEQGIDSPLEKQRLINRIAKNYMVTTVIDDTGISKDQKKSADYTVKTFKDTSSNTQLVTLSSQPDLKASDNLGYIEYVNKKVISEIGLEQKAVAKAAIIRLERKINKQLAEVKAERENQIKRLLNQQNLDVAKIKTKIGTLTQKDLRDKRLGVEELNHHYQIAEALGITAYNAPRKIQGSGVIIDMNREQNDLYLRGTKFFKHELALLKSKEHTLVYEKKLSKLQAKLASTLNNQDILALKNRTDDTPYVKQIEEQLVELNRLKSLSFDLNSVTCYYMEGQPIIDTTATKPYKSFILTAALIGILLSIFVIISQIGFSKIKAFELSNH